MSMQEVVYSVAEALIPSYITGLNAPGVLSSCLEFLTPSLFLCVLSSVSVRAPPLVSRSNLVPHLSHYIPQRTLSDPRPIHFTLSPRRSPRVFFRRPGPASPDCARRA
eukprot:811272-Pyramimonas_sp.AAC.1